MSTLQEQIDLSGPPRRVAIITGGSHGLGLEMARTLALAGADICIAARGVDRLEQAQQKLQAEIEREVLAIPTDVTDSSSCSNLIQKTLSHFEKLDILVNNAGIGDGPGRGKKVWELSDDEWQNSVAVNLDGTFYCTRSAIPVMQQQQSGIILNIASGMGMRATPQSPGYAASKAGVINLTATVSAALARDNIRVNCITPGLVAQQPASNSTEKQQQLDRGKFITVGRLGEAWELGPLALFLCSDASSYVTGANFCIDGGGLAGGIAPTGYKPDINGVNDD